MVHTRTYSVRPAGRGLLALALASAPLGAIGGLTFWLVALRGLKPLNEHTSPGESGD